MIESELQKEVEATVALANSTEKGFLEKGFLSYDLPSVELPEKEAATVRLIAIGRTHKSIAEEFNVSAACVDQRKKRAMQRVGVTTLAGLIHYAIAAQLVNLGEAQ